MTIEVINSVYISSYVQIRIYYPTSCILSFSPIRMYNLTAILIETADICDLLLIIRQDLYIRNVSHFNNVVYYDCILLTIEMRVVYLSSG